MATITTFLFLLATIVCSTGCPPGCTCKCHPETTAGRVECTAKGLSVVPAGIDSHSTRILDLSRNVFPVMAAEMFHRTGLIRLEKLFVVESQVRIIPGGAFRGLESLLELDLQGNLLEGVPRDALRSCARLTKLNLSRNPISSITKIDFHLPNLDTLDLSQCQISLVHPGSFNSPSLEWLDLSGNLLKTFPGLQNLPLSLKGLQLHNNPWNCNCGLKSLNRGLKLNVVPVLVAPVCQYPEELRHQLVKDLDIEGCALRVVQTEYYFEAEEGENVTMFCRVDPSSSPSNFTWFFRGNPLEKPSGSHYFIEETNESSTLFIYWINPGRNGTFQCYAENSAGVASANYTVMLIPRKIMILKNNSLVKPLAATLGTVLGALGLVGVGMVAVKRCNRSRAGRRPGKSILKPEKSGISSGVIPGMIVGNALLNGSKRNGRVGFAGMPAAVVPMIHGNTDKKQNSGNRDKYPGAPESASKTENTNNSSPLSEEFGDPRELSRFYGKMFPVCFCLLLCLYKFVVLISMKPSKDLFLIPKLLMITAGTWELDLVGASNAKKKFYKFYSVIMWIAYHTSHVSFSIKFIELLGGDSIEKVVESASMIIIVFLLAIKMALCRRKQMTEVLENATKKEKVFLNDENSYLQKIYSGHSKYALIINISLTVWSFYVGLFLTVGGSFDYFRPPTPTLNTTLGEPVETKPLHVLLWYPFDEKEYYGLVIFYEFFSILFSDLYNSCLQSLLNTMMVQIAADLKILQYYFRNVGLDVRSGRETSEEQAYEDFKMCASRYQQVIEHTTELNKALRFTLLIEYVVSSIMLASILVQVLSGKKPIFNTFYFGILAFQWCLLAWNANEIKQQSEKLGMSIYESNWYKRGKRTNQLAFITVLRTRRPLYLTIGPFGEMSINTAISTLKLAYSYVSIMS